MFKSLCLVGAGAAAFVVGCGPTQIAGPKEFTDSKRGLQFNYPADWVVEELAEQNVLLVSSPVQEAGWQTNVFLEVRTDPDRSTPVETRLAEIAESLQERKKGFVLQSSTALANHSSGLVGGELIYEHSSQGVPLTEREVVLWMTNDKVLFVTGSAVTALWAKYERQLNIVFDSVRPAS